MRLWHWVAAAGVGSVGAALVIALLSRMWQSCDVGVNASADAGALLFGYGPAVAVATGLSTLGILALGDRPQATTRMSACVGAVLVAAVICWIALSIGHDPGGGYPSPRCVGNIPGWWPAWLPL